MSVMTDIKKALKIVRTIDSFFKKRKLRRAASMLKAVPEGQELTKKERKAAKLILSSARASVWQSRTAAAALEQNHPTPQEHSSWLTRTARLLSTALLLRMARACVRSLL